MKLITWNVNSIRTRMERVVAVLKRHEPDVLCLQEIKATDDVFPVETFNELGYRSSVLGQRTYNGVAVLSKNKPDEIQRGFMCDPIPEQARVLGIAVSGVQVLNLYVVNGQAVGTEKYDLKLEWLDRLTDWLKKNYDPSKPLIAAGDFNIAPDDRDVYDPKVWRGKVLCSEPERTRLRTLLDWGLNDLLRAHTDEAGIYSWWDYRHGAFHRGMGLRIDLILGTAPMAERLVSVEVDRNERKPTSGPGKPSDHAPVIAWFRDSP